jgi:asparagine synthase (glutamine-hydrolysing)
MSIIAGIWQKDSQPVDATILSRMLRTLGPPTPDGEACWALGPVGFGHREPPMREALHEHELVWDKTTDCRMVWNGRLDNRQELIERFRSDGIQLGRQTDPKLALAAYQKWGADGVRHLLGDFALAIWDGKARRLLCARDPLGVKPLYYYFDGGRLLFASEVSAILEVPGVPRRVNEAMIAEYLLMDFQDREGTPFEGIRQVPPAHVLCLEDGRLSLRRYWDVDPALYTRYVRDEDYLERFSELFREAVRCRLPDHGAGVLLSGGIDSTGVAAVAQTIRRVEPQASRLEAYTFVHPGFLQEEWQALCALMDRYGIPLHLIRQEAEGKCLTSYDVYRTSAQTLHYQGFVTLPFILARAAENRTTVLLTGFGADELFRTGEVGYLRDLLRRGRLPRLVHELRALQQAYGVSVTSTAQALLWDQLPATARRWVKAACGRGVPDWMDRAFAKRTAVSQRTPCRRLKRFSTYCQEESYRAMTGAPMSVALAWMDSAAARYGIECRHPFLDRRLLEYVVSIPADVKLRTGYRKMFFQRSLERICSFPVRRREGTEAIVPPANETLELEKDRRTLEDKTFPLESPVYRFITRAGLDGIRNRYLAGDTRYRNLLWLFANLEQWLLDFVPNEPVGEESVR